jgi:hypothetical protein
MLENSSEAGAVFKDSSFVQKMSIVAPIFSYFDCAILVERINEAVIRPVRYFIVSPEDGTCEYDQANNPSQKASPAPPR